MFWGELLLCRDVILRSDFTECHSSEMTHDFTECHSYHSWILNCVRGGFFFER
jgi:hypothetical protein